MIGGAGSRPKAKASIGLIGIFCRTLIRRRRTLLAGTLLVWMFFAITAASVFVSPGPQGPGHGPDLRFTAFFYLIILWAGLLIGGRSAFVVATLAVAAQGYSCPIGRRR